MPGRRPAPDEPLAVEVERVEVERPGASVRRLFSHIFALAAVAGLVALIVAPPAFAAPGVVLNEVNCTGTDWVELTNTGTAEASLASWLLTDDPLDRVPLRDTHRMRFPADAVIAPGGHLVVTQGTGGFPFGLSCGDDTLRLADATDALVDSFTLPVLADGGMTYGRLPDGTGDWVVTLPTSGAANAAAPGASDEDPAWLYNPLQVNEIDLQASPAALAQLNTVPTEYVEAQITMHDGATAYGPYTVGLKLKGHASFQTLDGKAAFKVKFGFAVPGQSFHGLKGLTLNNMLQDPSMIAEASSALLAAATGAPTARVGYAYVRLNGVDYGLYANVETVDAVMAKRWFASTRHIYEANYANDVVPGRAGEFEVDEGSSTDLSDLEALAAADAGGAGDWWQRMQPVADLAEMTRVWAAEHYLGQWDGYSFGAGVNQPNNYYLHSDASGRFSFLVTGTDQTWLERPSFGAFAKGVLMRDCIVDTTCRQLYVDAVRAIGANPAIATLADEARAIRAVIAPWRAVDPRLVRSVAAGEAQADEKIATMAARPAELAAWLASPTFADVTEPPERAGEGGGGGGGGNGGGGSGDLGVSGTVTPISAPVGASHVWRLQVTNTGDGVATGVVLDVQLSPNVVYGFGETARGPGCVAAGSTVRCDLDLLGPSGDGGSTAEVVIGTNVTAAGEVSLSAVASFAGADPTPADDTLVLRANTPAPATPSVRTPAAMRPLLAKPVAEPAAPVAGRRFTFTLRVTRSDTGTALRTGTMDCNPSLARRTLTHTDSFKAGKIRLSLVVPASAKGKLLTVKIAVTASGRTAAHTYTFAVR